MVAWQQAGAVLPGLYLCPGSGWLLLTLLHAEGILGEKPTLHFSVASLGKTIPPENPEGNGESSTHRGTPGEREHRCAHAGHGQVTMPTCVPAAAAQDRAGVKGRRLCQLSGL